MGSLTSMPCISERNTSMDGKSSAAQCSRWMPHAASTDSLIRVLRREWLRELSRSITSNT